MSLTWFDGFDHLSSSQMSRKYDTFSGNVITGTSTRFNSGQGVQFTSGVAGLEKVLTSQQAWRIGFAFQMTAYQNNPIIIYLKDSSTQQVALQIENRNITVRGASNALLGTSTRAIAINTWYFIEWYIVVEDTLSSGHCQVYVNGEQWLTVTSGDTKATGNATADRFGITGASGTTINYDDLFVYFDSVTGSPTFTGDARVVTLTPSGNGNYSQFVGSDSDSTNNYLLVDETTPNDDTDYVQSSTVSNRDSYAMSDLASTPASVLGVQVSCTQKKDDAGARTGKLFFRISGTDYDGSAFSPATSYATAVHLRETSPATSSAWTGSEVNGLEAGIKVES